MRKEKILVTGALGQVGTELVRALRDLHGVDQVVATDIRPSGHALIEEGPYRILDVTDQQSIVDTLKSEGVSIVYHLAAILSGTGEQKPQLAWQVNMNGLLSLLDIAVDHKIERIFWPSSIAVFGPNSPKKETPQDCFMDPETVYGISKQSGERWCAYYHKKFGLDIRSLRYPGIVSYSAPAGGGTTDYAVDIFFEAVKQGKYSSFIEAGTYLPMIYMPDAIKATIDLMQADAGHLTVYDSYNLSGMSFDPAELAEAITECMPEFKISYKADFRQKIAESWPQSINDSRAREDWGWQPAFDIRTMTADMIENVKKIVKSGAIPVL